jgi:histidyl-tRNA synthetase
MLTHRPRGTSDLLPGIVEKWQFVERVARDVCRRFNYHEIRTPLFEHTELFQRGVGETTDIVEKEMYTFTDKGGRSLTLRPEGTAGVVRAFVENKLYGQPETTKLYYIGPMFRYERPQAGRERQFVQFGIEALGSSDPGIDAEILALAMTFLLECGLQGHVLEINSVGCPTCRSAYRDRLMQHLSAVREELCQDCQNRFERNPMRILDCKVPRDRELTADAPTMLDCLCDACSSHFEAVKQYLDDYGIPYTVNPRIVRGLDYYTQTAFEITYNGLTLIGGGRYNGLVKQIGGPETPGIGFGCGLGRVIDVLMEQGVDMQIAPGIDVFLIAMGKEAERKAASLLQEMRTAGLTADKDYLGKSVKAQMKAADRMQARQVVILGEEELARGEANVKDMATGEQKPVPLNNLIRTLKMKKG